MPFNNITPSELKARLDNGEDMVVVDVRQLWELDISSVDFATHIVLDTLPQRLNEIPKDKTVVMICRSGGRSMQACMFLDAQGWGKDQDLLNLQGGILGWARDVDDSLPKNY